MTEQDLVQLNLLIEDLTKSAYEQGRTEEQLCGDDVETMGQEVSDAQNDLRSFVIRSTYQYLKEQAEIIAKQRPRKKLNSTQETSMNFTEFFATVRVSEQNREEIVAEIIKRVEMHDRLLMALEQCRDMICEEFADGQYHEVADRAADLLKEVANP